MIMDIIAVLKKYKNIGVIAIISVTLIVTIKGWNNYWEAKKQIEVQRIKYENQIKKIYENITITDKGTIKKTEKTKYRNGIIEEKMIETKIIKDKKSENSKKTQTNVASREGNSHIWIIGLDYDFYLKNIYIKLGLCIFNRINIEAAYPINFETSDIRLRIGFSVRI